MASKIIYCAQAFWRRNGRLVGGVPHQFLNEERASDGADALMTGGAVGAAVFSVEGYPEIDLWQAPTLIASFGDVPAVTDSEWPEVA